MEDKTFIKAHITGTYTETEERIENDKLLLNMIESERAERTEDTKYIEKRLRKHDFVLNFVISLLVGLLLSMISIALQR
nr:hypothetical protein LBZUJACN_LBZUJACN_CDS_0043 [Caudoviricetes sp.]CAI9751066.1 hypothetical protein MIHLRAQX_MIHLRAQX_CDS_0043 [Caudoviricetes sp.]